jgi:multidrug resistance efflux pump
MSVRPLRPGLLQGGVVHLLVAEEAAVKQGEPIARIE